MKKQDKIGILSMQRIVNYGSYLQALGLKMLVENLGYQIVFVDYHIGKWYSWKNIKNTSWYRKLRSFLAFLKPMDNYREREIMEEQYDTLGLDKKYHYRTRVKTLIIGSDEVFNYIQDGPMVAYSPELLGKNNRADKVISYAASCGNLTRDRLRQYGKEDEFSSYIGKMNAVSVRDIYTFNLVWKMTGKMPEIHMDPVLLNDFSAFFEANISLRDYILVYGYTERFTEEEGTFINHYAKKKNKKVYCLGGRQSFCKNTIFCKPLEVLAYFKKADFIITDTFHGTIFSIITESNFATIVRQGEDGNQNKLSFLIEQLGIQRKRLQDMKKLEDTANAVINYSYINSLRRKEREKALEYLRRNL